MAEAKETVDEDVWWVAEVIVRNVETHYRWLLVGRGLRLRLVDGRRRRRLSTSPTPTDFVVSATTPPPEWTYESVVYQVFPDRFARVSGSEHDEVAGPPAGVPLPTWAVPRAWTDAPEGRGPNTPREFFGGRPRRRARSPRPPRCAQRRRALPDARVPRGVHPPVRRLDVRTRRSPPGRGRCPPASRRRRPRRGDPGDRRHHPQPLRPRPRLVRPRAGPERRRAVVLPVRSGAPVRVRVLVQRAVPAQVRPHQCGPPRGARRRRRRPGPHLAPRRVRTRRMACRRGQHGRPHGLRRRHPRVRQRRACRDGRRGRRPAARGGARPRCERGPARRRMARHDELRGLHAAGVVLAAQLGLPRDLHGTARRGAGHHRSAGGRVAPRLPRPHPLAVAARQLEHPRQPRHRPHPDGRGDARASGGGAGPGRGPAGSARWCSPETRSVRRDGGARTPAPRSRGTTRTRGTWRPSTPTSACWASVGRSPALATGGLRWLHVGTDALAFVREHPEESVLVVVARNQAEPVRVPLADLGARGVHHEFGFAADVVADQVVIDVPSAGAGVWRVEGV